MKALALVQRLTLFQLTSNVMHYWDHRGEAGAKPKVISSRQVLLSLALILGSQFVDIWLFSSSTGSGGSHPRHWISLSLNYTVLPDDGFNTVLQNCELKKNQTNLVSVFILELLIPTDCHWRSGIQCCKL